MDDLMQGTLCGICGTIHGDDQYEQTGGGSRPDWSTGDRLDLNWVTMRCLLTGREFQLSWLEDPEE